MTEGSRLPAIAFVPTIAIAVAIRHLVGLSSSFASVEPSLEDQRSCPLVDLTLALLGVEAHCHHGFGRRRRGHALVIGLHSHRRDPSQLIDLSEDSFGRNGLVALQ